MKQLVLYLLLPVFLISLFFCSKEKSFEGGTKPSAYEWQFKEGSALFKGPIDTAFLYNDASASGYGLTLTGITNDRNGVLFLNISNFNIQEPATYKGSDMDFWYAKNASLLYVIDPAHADDFTVTIDKIDSTQISGSFSGSVKDGGGVDKEIVEGTFKTKYTPPSNVTPTDSGRVTFWSKNNCNGGNITVKINDGNKEISTFVSNEPADCVTDGMANFKLKVGRYIWKAYCGTTDSVSGVIDIAKDGCIKKEVLFLPPQNGQVTFWAKSFCTLGGNIEVAINGSQTEVISVVSATEPGTCDEAGNANFSLPAGTYNWVTACGSENLSGTITVTAGQCIKKEIAYPQQPAQYSLVGAPGDCINPYIQGHYYAGVTLNASNHILVDVNVTVPGTYTITTNVANNMSFSASGVFPSAGTFNVTLTGQGQPVNTGRSMFTVTGVSSSCGGIPVDVQPPPASTGAWSFTEGTKSYSGFYGSQSISFGDNPLLFGKVVQLYGKNPSGDTTCFLHIQFPSAATEPIPGTYITDPNTFSSNTTEFRMYFDIPQGGQYDLYRVKSPTGAISNLRMTIKILSYNSVSKVIDGTFSGNAWDKTGAVVNITNGKFNGVVSF